MNRVEELRTEYQLQAHPEGGWFSEVFKSQGKEGSRPFMGSIYFLLDGAEVSHFHQIDCEEVWYFHEGCGLRITVLEPEKPLVTELLLGGDTAAGQRAMVVIPKGAIFASENLDPAGYSFVSCATAPAFSYEDFRLVGKAELKRLCTQSACGKTGPQPPADYEKLEHLAFE